MGIFVLGLQFAEHLPRYVRLELEQLLAAVQQQAQNVLPVDSIPVTDITINELSGTLDYSQFPPLAASRLLGRQSGSAGDPEPITIGAGLLMAGAVLSALTTADHVLMSDGGNPPTPMDDGNGNFLYIDYTP